MFLTISVVLLAQRRMSVTWDVDYWKMCLTMRLLFCSASTTQLLSVVVTLLSFVN